MPRRRMKALISPVAFTELEKVIDSAYFRQISSGEAGHILCFGDFFQVKEFIGQELLAHLYSTGHQVRDQAKRYMKSFKVLL